MRGIWLARPPLFVILLSGFGLWLLLQLLAQALWVLMLGLLAMILAAAMNPIVVLIRRIRLPRGWRIPRGVAVLLIYLVAAGILGLMAYIIGGVLVTEVFNFLAILPLLAADLGQQLSALDQTLNLPPQLTPAPEDLAAQVGALTAQVTEGIRFAGLFVEGVVVFFTQLFIVLTLALFLVVEAERIMRFWVALFPPSRREKVRRVTHEMGEKMSYWLLGQMTIATITGTLAGTAAWLLGLPYPALIGVVTALVDLIPVLGIAILAVPAFFLGLSQSIVIAVMAAVFFYALSQLEGSLLAPLITKRAVQLSPSLVIIAIPLGLAFYGIIGALIAIPVTAALQVVVVEVVLPWLHEQHEATEQQRAEVRSQNPEITRL